MEFNKSTRFLVTGGAGFIGSNITKYLLDKGYSVRVLDNFMTGKKSNIKEFFKNPKFELIEGDICDIDTCLKSCDGIDYVFQEAALGSVSRSIEDPLLSNKINILGFLNMLHAAYLKKVKRFIHASSSSVYGDSPELPKVEGKEGNILSPYGITKKTDELYGNLYTKLFKLPTIGLRYFNVYGPKQDPKSVYAAVIPLFINDVIDDKQVYINGDGNNSRDFTYVDDVVEANIKACLCDEKYCGDVYNIGHAGKTTINDLYNKICSILSKKPNAIYRQERPGDVKHSNASIDKAEKILGYKTHIDIDEGLRRTIEFYINNKNSDI